MDERLRAFGVALGVGIGGLAAGFGVVLVVVLALSLAGVEITPVLEIVLSLVFATGVGFMGTSYAYLRYRGIPLSSLGIELPSIKELGLVVGALVLSMGYLLVVGLVVQQLGVDTAENQTAVVAMENPEVVLYLLPGAYLLIGPGEELLFRGVVQNRIREAFGAVPGVLLASAVFAAVHAVSLVGDPVAMLVSITVLMGPALLLGSLYEYTGNLVVSILVHGTYDAIIFLALYAAATGGADAGTAAALLP